MGQRMQNTNDTLDHAAHRISLRDVTWRWLFDPTNGDGLQPQLDAFIGVLIVASVFAIILEHNPAIYQPLATQFHWFDLITVAIFSAEYLLRLATAPADPEFAQHRFPRLRYAFSFVALVDLIAIAPFYFMQFVSVDVEALRMLRLVRLLRMFKLSRQLVPAWHEFQRLNQGRTLRAKIHALLEPTGHSGRLHIYVDNFIVFWIALSIICVVLETVESVRAVSADYFAWIDVIAFTVFTIEYAARLYSAPENPDYQRSSLPRLTHARSFGAIIDLLTILPFLLEHFVVMQLDLRFLRVFRLTRMLKLTRYTSATNTLSKVIRREWHIIFSSIFVMLLLVVLTASLGYLFEHPAQPDKFENIPQSIYWAVVTLASVGYGDISPITPMGRSLTVVLSLLGIGIFAIPAGLLASAFTDQLRIDREYFERTLLEALARGETDLRHQEHLVAEAERLHLSSVEFDNMVAQALDEHRKLMAEQEVSLGHLMLDTRAHPDLAADQFRIMVAQLALMVKAADRPALEAALANGKPDAELHAQILALLLEQPSSSQPIAS